MARAAGEATAARARALASLAFDSAHIKIETMPTYGSIISDNLMQNSQIVGQISQRICKIHELLATICNFLEVREQMDNSYY